MKKANNIWLGWNNIIAHPNSPAGGGGGGFFRDPRSLGLSANLLSSSSSKIPDPHAPATRHGYYIEALRAAAKFNIRLIPGIMWGKGWKNGARFMEHWFKGNKYEVPATVKDEDYAKSSTPDRSLTMEWVLGFERVNKVYQQMIQDKIWVKNDDAKKRIVEVVKKMYGKSGFCEEKSYFGDLSQSSILALNNNYYITYQTVDTSDVKDDITATLAKFVFRVAIKGYTEPTKAKPASGQAKVYKFVIEEVGIYFRDSYDFTDDGWFSQPLGYWDYTGPSEDWTGFFERSKTYITNDDFNDWRESNNKGGDYLVLSKDMNIIKRNPPDMFEFKID